MLLDDEEDAFQASYNCLEARREREKHAMETKLKKNHYKQSSQYNGAYEDLRRSTDYREESGGLYFEEDSGSGDGVLR